MRWSLLSALLVAVHAVSAYAQEKVRVFCDETDPANKCPGELCRCTPDTLEVTFDGRSRSTLEAGDLDPGARIIATIVTDTKSSVRGWNFGVAHDDSVLELVAVTSEGTDARGALLFGFIVLSKDRVEQCLGDDPGCPVTREGGGWLFGTAIELAAGATPRELPRKRNSIAVASYRLLRPISPPGTTIGFSERLKNTGSPTVRIEIITDGRFRRPATLIDGFLASEDPPSERSFLRGDADGDGRINVSDAVRILLALFLREDLACEDGSDADDEGTLNFVDALILLRFLFDRGPPGPIGTCGPDSTVDLLGCAAAASCR